MKNLHRDRYQNDISEDRRGDREWRSYIGISRKRERGRKEKSKSRDLSNRSLKTDWKTDNRKPMYRSFERERGEDRKRERPV